MLMAKPTGHNREYSIMNKKIKESIERIVCKAWREGTRVVIICSYDDASRLAFMLHGNKTESQWSLFARKTAKLQEEIKNTLNEAERMLVKGATFDECRSYVSGKLGAFELIENRNDLVKVLIKRLAYGSHDFDAGSGANGISSIEIWSAEPIRPGQSPAWRF